MLIRHLRIHEWFLTSITSKTVLQKTYLFFLQNQLLINTLHKEKSTSLFLSSSFNFDRKNELTDETNVLAISWDKKKLCAQLLLWSHSSCMSASCTAPPQGQAGQGNLCSLWLATDLLIAKVSEPLNILQNQIWQWKGVCMFNTCTVITYSGVTVFKTVGILVEMVARGESL